MPEDSPSSLNVVPKRPIKKSSSASLDSASTKPVFKRIISHYHAELDLDLGLRNIAVLIDTIERVFDALPELDPSAKNQTNDNDEDTETGETRERSINNAKAIIDKMSAAVDFISPCLLTVDAQLRSIQNKASHASYQAELKNYFSFFYNNPPKNDAPALLNLTLLELHNREETDINQAVVSTLNPEKKDDVEISFETHLAENRKKLPLTDIIRYGASVSFIGSKKEDANVPTHSPQAIPSLQTHLQTHAINYSEEQTQTLLNTPMSQIVAFKNPILKEAISTWLAKKLNHKFANKDQLLSGPPRNNALENVIETFLANTQLSQAPLLRWIRAIIGCRKAAQLITTHKKQLDSRTKDFKLNASSRSTDESLALLNSISSDFMGLTQGIKKFIAYAKRENELRLEIARQSPLTEEMNETSITIDTINENQTLIPSQDHFQNIDDEFANFTDQLSALADQVRALKLKPTLSHSKEIIQDVMLTMAYTHIKAPNFSQEDYETLETLISEGIRKPTKKDLGKFEKLHNRESLFLARLELLNTLKGKIEEKSEGKDEANLYDSIVSFILAISPYCLNLTTPPEDKLDESIKTLLSSIKTILKPHEQSADSLTKDIINFSLLSDAQKQLYALCQDLLKQTDLTKLSAFLEQKIEKFNKDLMQLQEDQNQEAEVLMANAVKKSATLLAKSPALQARRASLSNKLPSIETTRRDSKASKDDYSPSSARLRENSFLDDTGVESKNTSQYSVSTRRRERHHKRTSTLISPETLIELSRTQMSISIQDRGGDTVLHYAAQANNEKAVGLFLSHNADPRVTNRHGKTPLDMDTNRLILNWQDIEGNTLLHTYTTKGQSQAAIDLLVHNPDLTKQNREHKTALEVVDKGNNDLLNQFTKSIPSSAHRDKHQTLYQTLMPIAEDAKAENIPQEKMQSYYQALITAAKLDKEEADKLKKVKENYKIAEQKFRGIIDYLYLELFKANNKLFKFNNSDCLILKKKLRAVQESILKIAHGADLEKTKSELINSPIIGQKRGLWESTVKQKIADIDWRFTEHSEEPTPNIPETTETESTEVLLKNTELHVLAERHDFKQIAAWVNSHKHKCSNKSILFATNAKGFTPIMQLTQQTIDTIQQRENYEQSLNAIFQAFSDIEIYLHGKLNTYKDGSKNHKDINNKIKEIKLAKIQITHGNQDAVTVLKNLRENAAIKKRRLFNFLSKPCETVKQLDKTLLMLKSPFERLQMIIDIKLKPARDKVNPSSKAYKQFTRQIEAIISAQDAIAKHENPITVLTNMKNDKRLSQSAWVLGKSVSLTEVDNVLKDISAPSALNNTSPPSDHVAKRRVTQRGIT